MELELSGEQQFFAETTRKYLEDKAPAPQLRGLRHDEAGFSPEYWSQGAELGWTSLLVSEEDGGGSMSGRPLVDLGLVAFEFGRHAAPGPLIAASVAAGALSRGGTAEQRSTVLAGLLSGDVLVTWAMEEPRPHDRLGDVTVDAIPTGDGVRLSGVKGPVEAGGQADQLLVTARTGDGLTQVLVPADAPGVTVTPLEAIDLTRRFARITLDGVELPGTAIVGEVGGMASQVDWQLQVTIALQLAEMVGAMDRAFEMTTQWAFDRYSFGRPLASYQELKHRFADMKLWLESGHAIADAAIAAVQDGAPDSWDLLSAGKAYLGHYGVELMHDCVQMHGGIGVTFDHDLHLYLRRVVLDAGQYGTVREHRERLTKSLEQLEQLV